MNLLIPLTEFITYLLFSFLIGHVVLQFVPESKKPSLHVPKPILLLSVLGIIVFSFGPVFQVIFYFAESVGMGLTLFSVLSDFQVGIAWIVTGWIATVLWMTIYVEGSKYLQAFLLLLMVFGVGYASHVASLSFWSGFISHTVHFLAVTLWTGVLLHVSWFAKDSANWKNFLRWFTPFAVGCLSVIVISGVIVMLFIVDAKEYIDAWVLPYGQLLLLKHISIVPLLAFALINGILMRKLTGTGAFDPRPWVKAESISLMVVFFFTGILGTLSPPHEVDFTVKSEGAANWVSYLLEKSIVPPINLEMAASFQGVLAYLLALLFLFMMILSYYKRTKPVLAVVFSLCFIVSCYLGMMTSVVLK